MPRQRRGASAPESSESTPAADTPAVVVQTPAVTVAEEVKSVGIWATIVASITALFTSERGPGTVSKTVREGFGWIGEGFQQLRDETGMVGRIFNWARGGLLKAKVMMQQGQRNDRARQQQYFRHHPLRRLFMVRRWGREV